MWIGKDPERALIIEELEKKRAETKISEPQEEEYVSLKKIISITDFCGTLENWNNPSQRHKKRVIRCRTEEEARYVCKAFGILDRHCNNLDGGRFSSLNTYFDMYGVNTCYSNSGEVESYLEKILKYDLVTYELREIDFTGVLPLEDIKRIDELTKLKPHKKISILEFWGSQAQWNLMKRPDYVSIHCNTEQKANYLCKALQNLQAYWADQSTPISPENNNYKFYLNNTIYNNLGQYNHITYAKLRLENIYDFSEIDFSGVLTPEEINEIEEILQKDGSYDKTDSFTL
jgi:hypothetical protein